MRSRLLLLALPLLLLSPALADEAAPVDPFVALDAAKMTLADGRLEDAREQLARIPAGQAEGYVDEEVVFQRMLLEAAFLDAANFLWNELGKMKLSQGGYATWLWYERDKYANNLAAEVRRYMELTTDGYELSFIRFRLPVVSDKHIQDVELYSDRQVLAAAAENWDKQREGLGKGLILAQARVAVALSAAHFYDMPAAGSVTIVTRRLAAGVPIYPALALDWIGETCHRLADAGNGLGQLSKGADTRLAQLLAAQPNAHLSQRIAVRAAPPKKAAPTASEKKPAKKSGKRRRKR